MHYIDIIILIFVTVFLGSIIYFRWIKKSPEGTGCHCYRAKTCNLKLDELKDITLNNINSNKAE